MGKTLKNFPLMWVQGNNKEYVVSVTYAVNGFPLITRYRGTNMNELKEQLSVVFKKAFLEEKAQWCMDKLDRAFNEHHEDVERWCKEYEVEYSPYLEIPMSYRNLIKGGKRGYHLVPSFFPFLLIFQTYIIYWKPLRLND